MTDRLLTTLSTRPQEAYLVKPPTLPRAYPHRQPGPLSSVAQSLRQHDEPMNANHLGTVENRLKITAGALIAALGTLGMARPSLGAAELLGFTGFFGSMAITPQVIFALVKAKTGLDLRQYYMSTQGDRRWLYKDTKYLPLQLVPAEEIEKVGDRLKIPRHLPNRREVIEDRIRQTAAQAQTWWMLVAGPATPIMASGFAHVLEPKASQFINRLRQNVAIRRLNKITESVEKDGAASSEIKKKSAVAIKKLFDTAVGKSPVSDLSLWWKGFQKNLAVDSGLKSYLLKTHTSAAIKKMSDQDLNRKISEYFQTLDYDSTLTPNPQQAKQVATFTEVISSKLSALEIIGNKLQNWIWDVNKGIDKKEYLPWAELQIEPEKGVLNQVENLKQALTSQTATGTDRLKALLHGPSASHIQALVENGKMLQASQLLGGDEKLHAFIKAIEQERSQKAASLIGGPLIGHIREGLRESIGTGLWRKRVFAGVGGAVLGFSALFYGLVLGNTKRPPSKQFTSADEMLAKYNENNDFQQLQKHIQLLRQQRIQLAPRDTQFESPGLLKSMFRNNQAAIYALNIRTFGAQDQNEDNVISPELNEQGTFLSAINRLDELKALGVNAIHMLPVQPIGVLKHMGQAGSLYAPADYHTLNPYLADNRVPMNVYQQARLFIQEAHKRGIQVMADVPSAASIDLAITRPDLIAVDEDGHARTPTSWTDIVMFQSDRRLVTYFEDYFKLMADDLGVDGFRVDVARARPEAFWKYFINKYPNHAWLAETYTEEDASPLENIPRDVPKNLLEAGFDSIYGQFHIFNKMATGQTYINYLNELQKTLATAANTPNNGISSGKSAIGTYQTHDDDETPMQHGGVNHSLMLAGLMAVTPHSNPYMIDGFHTGYDKRIDLFNYTQPHIGQHPEIAPFLSQAMQLRKQYAEVFAQGRFQPAKIEGNNSHQLFAYTLTAPEKSLLVIGNKTPNVRNNGILELPEGISIPSGSVLSNLLPAYGEPNSIAMQDPGTLQVNLGPSSLMVFELPQQPAPQTPEQEQASQLQKIQSLQQQPNPFLVPV